jgi:hypothetical protein
VRPEDENPRANGDVGAYASLGSASQSARMGCILPGRYVPAHSGALADWRALIWADRAIPQAMRTQIPLSNPFHLILSSKLQYKRF